MGRNALRHGACSVLPVVPGLERTEDWEAFRDGFLLSMAPVGTLEEMLIGRVALSAWRLERIVRYETATIAAGFDVDENTEQLRPQGALTGKDYDLLCLQEQQGSLPPKAALSKAEKDLETEQEELEFGEQRLRFLTQLPELSDETPVSGDDAGGALQDLVSALTGGVKYSNADWADLYAEIGVPKEALDEPYEWSGWTAGMVRAGLALLSQLADYTPEKLLTGGLAQRKRMQESKRDKLEELCRKVEGLRLQVKANQDRRTSKRILPSAETLGTICRYEAHLNRQLLQALHELQRLQAARAGVPITPPAALDVTIDAGGQAAEALLDTGTG